MERVSRVKPVGSPRGSFRMRKPFSEFFPVRWNAAETDSMPFAGRSMGERSGAGGGAGI